MAQAALRVIAALAVAAATSATLFVAVDIALLLWADGEGNTPGFIAGSIVFLWPIAFAVAAIHAAGLGLPAYLVLSRYGLTPWWVSLPGGFIAGALPYAALALPWRDPDPNLVAAHIIQPFSWPHYTATAVGLGLLGMAGGVAAWTAWSALSRSARPPAAPAPPP